ncbi:MAG: hypothetical protein ACI952_001783, partial [Flavobacteriales bacterium]
LTYRLFQIPVIINYKQQWFSHHNIQSIRKV